MSTVFEKLEEHCARHDWFYTMSDDFRVYSAGLESSQTLNLLFYDAKSEDREKAEDIFSRYQPEW